ncbi:MAG TPA: TonB family protein [Steroidobacteraceae bacterium]|nr:TonB family protein [Steroidobacteraceae bacterium]
MATPNPPLVTGRIKRADAVRVSGKDAQAFTLLRGETAQQHYPPAAKRAGIRGVVVVDLLLNDMGQVLEAQAVSESPPGHGFALAALDAAKTFEFSNPLQKQVLMSVTVEFKP